MKPLFRVVFLSCLLVATTRFSKLAAQVSPADTARAIEAVAQAIQFYKEQKLESLAEKCRLAIGIFDSLKIETHPKLRTAQRLLGGYYSLKLDYKNAHLHLQKALEIQQRLGVDDPLEAARVHYQVGHLYRLKSKNKEAIEELETALALPKNHFPPTDEEYKKLQFNALSELAVVFNYSFQFQKAVETIQKSITIGQSLELNIGRELGYLANFYNNMGNYPQAIETYQKAMVLDPNGSLLFNMGNAYDKLGNKRKAFVLRQQGLELMIKTDGEQNPQIGTFCIDLGTAYSSANQNAEAITALQKGIDLVQRFQPEHYFALALAHMNLGKAWAGQHGDIEQARLFLQQSWQFYKKMPNPNPAFESVFFSSLGFAELNFGSLDSAEQIARKRIENSNKNVADMHQLLGNVVEQKKDFAAAIEQYTRYFELKKKESKPLYFPARKLAEAYLKADSLDASRRFFQLTEDLLGFEKGGVAAVENLLEFLLLQKNWAQLHLAQHRKTGDITHLQQAAERLKIYDQTVQQMRASESLPTGEENLGGIRKGYELAISTARKIADDGGEQLAFDFSEKTKSVALQAGIQNSKALQFSQIPDSLLAAENDLRIEIAYFEKRLFAIEKSGAAANDSLAMGFASRIFDLRNRYDFLKNRLETEFPDYFKLKYDCSVISLADVQRDLLDADQALLEYFVGDSSIFIFKIEKEKFELREVKKDFPLERWVTELRDATTNFFTNPKFENQYDSLAQIFTERSHQLFQKLVAPIAQNLPPRLIIVPDGVLGYLPFEALLAEPPSAPAHRWQQHNYLISKHSVQYCPSATMLREMTFRKTKTEPTVDFLGFAPHFSGDTAALAAIFQNDLTMRKDLASLPFSGEEVARLSKLMHGKYLAGADASKSEFLAAAPTAKILHLATHGQANDRAGDYCFLAFAKNLDAPEQSVLFAREIYNLNLNADLVVLSACETGIGQLQNGEGILSLARAFAYAGAKSIVTSFWSVSDAKTKDLMLDFYKNLRRGEAKDLALRQAKLDFLKKNKGQAAHPFFWAGFVGMGDF